MARWRVGAHAARVTEEHQDPGCAAGHHGESGPGRAGQGRAARGAAAGARRPRQGTMLSHGTAHARRRLLGETWERAHVLVPFPVGSARTGSTEYGVLGETLPAGPMCQGAPGSLAQPAPLHPITGSSSGGPGEEGCPRDAHCPATTQPGSSQHSCRGGGERWRRAVAACGVRRQLRPFMALPGQPPSASLSKEDWGWPASQRRDRGRRGQRPAAWVWTPPCQARLGPLALL